MGLASRAVVTVGGGILATVNAVAAGPRYDAVRRRVSSLIEGHQSASDIEVPACPGWTVGDVLRHLVGVARDLADNEVDGYTSESWTERQLVGLAGKSVPDLLSLWDDAARRLPAALPVADVPAVVLALGDAIVHEADLASAIAPARRVPEADVLAAIKTGVSRWRPALAASPAPPLRIAVRGDRDWWLGLDRGDSVTLDVQAYDLFRLLFGRRSRAEVGALGWSSDPTPYLDAGLPYPFKWSEASLDET